MSAIFVMDEDTYVHGVWSYGTPGFDCLGMLFKQKGEPWMSKWAIRPGHGSGNHPSRGWGHSDHEGY